MEQYRCGFDAETDFGGAQQKAQRRDSERAVSPGYKLLRGTCILHVCWVFIRCTQSKDQELRYSEAKISRSPKGVLSYSHPS